MNSIFNRPFYLDVVEIKGNDDVYLPSGWETDHFSKPEEDTTYKYKGKAYTVAYKGEKYLSIFSIKRIAGIFAAAIITLATAGVFCYLFQGVRDLFTGRQVVLLLEDEHSIGGLSSVYETTPKKTVDKFSHVQDFVKESIKSTPPISGMFTTEKSIEEQKQAHGNARTFLEVNVPKVGGKVYFVSPDALASDPSDNMKNPIGKLDSDIFSFEYTKGVLEDVEKDGQRKSDDIVVYTVCSQYNGCECPDIGTIKPGFAYYVYHKDKTQGPQAQLAFSPDQIEILNCSGNIGFNGLCHVLDESTKDQIAHGYFMPKNDKAKELVSQLKSKGHLLEYICIENIPNNGTKPVHQMLVAAPAFGEYNMVDENAVVGDERDEIQYLCALQAFRAQFKQCIELAKKSDKPVKFKPASVGLGVFGNNPKNFAKAFYDAGVEYNDELKKHKVEIIFQIFNVGDKPSSVVPGSLPDLLNLTEKA